MPSHRKIAKAVIPAAGFGTRMLPATKAVPKEMLPVAGRPLIQYSPTRPLGIWIGTSPGVPHCWEKGTLGLLLGMTYHTPFDGRNTAMSVFPSPS